MILPVGSAIARTPNYMIFKKYDSLIVKIIKLLALAKFGSLRGSTAASLKFWQSAKNWQDFETGGRTYFRLLADRFSTYTDPIGSSVKNIKAETNTT